MSAGSWVELFRGKAWSDRKTEVKFAKKNLHWSSCPGAVHEVRRGFNPGGQGGLECKHQGAIAELK